MTGRVAVAAVLLLRLGGTHGNTPARNCKDLHGVVVSEGGKETICEERKSETRNKVLTTVYVRPGDDFKGVSLEVTQGYFSAPDCQVAWFGLDKCYNDKKWIKMDVDVREARFKFDYLHFNLSIEGYEGKCIRSSPNSYITDLRIVAHGSSNWTSTAEETGGRCQGPEEFTNLQNPNTCTDPPDSITTSTTSTPPPPGTTTTTTTTTTPPPPSTTTTTTTTTPPPPPATTTTTTTTTTSTPPPPGTTTTTTATTTTAPPGTTTTTTTTTTSTPPPPVVIAVPIAVVVAVILAIVVCVTYRRRRRGQGEGQEIQYHPQSSPASPEIGSVHIMENSLYEPFPGPVTPAAREQQGTVVVENSLYEPLPGSLTAAAREQQEIEVVENSLYEPFPASMTAPTNQ